jgi:organic radical activating enzyme
MNAQQQIEHLKNHYDVLQVIDLGAWHSMTYANAQDWLRNQCQQAKQDRYEQNQRLVFVHQTGDFYVKTQKIGLILRNLQIILNEYDITNSFVIVLSNNPDLQQELTYAHSLNIDQSNCIQGIPIEGSNWQVITLDKNPSTINEMYQYDSVNPLKMSLSELSEKEKFLLTESKVFCIYPWIHLNANPDGNAYPCCMTNHKHPIGTVKNNNLSEIWNGLPMKKVRSDMLTEKKIIGCNQCYEKEEAGFFSGRLSANKHHGHHIDKVSETLADGTFNRFEMIYWDIRFSNLCNLKCRSCGHIYSSQWYQDQAKIAGPQWKLQNSVLNYAGRDEHDMWSQLSTHLDYVEQIYFAGGEPLIMEEHYNILEELVRRKRFDVRLIYNTNFTHTDLKGKSVFEYWKLFDSVSVGASLDASYARGEYIRKGTNWSTVIKNRQQMIEICPNVDFYISPTLSIMNALHLPDFHREWVADGLIKAQDLNVNILLDPSHYRIDIAPEEYKKRIRDKFEQHLDWLRPQDRLNRATVGFESAINILNGNNNHLLEKFWEKTNQLDQIRRENILDVIPELEALK